MAEPLITQVTGTQAVVEYSLAMAVVVDGESVDKDFRTRGYQPGDIPFVQLSVTTADIENVMQSVFTQGPDHSSIDQLGELDGFTFLIAPPQVYELAARLVELADAILDGPQRKDTA